MSDSGDSIAIARLEVRMAAVEAGVANFRDFQKDAREFFTEWRTRSEEQSIQRDSEARHVKEAKDDDNAHLNQSIAKKSLLWTIAGVLVSIAAIAVSILAVTATLYVSKHSHIDPVQLFRDFQSTRMYAQNEQFARW